MKPVRVVPDSKYSGMFRLQWADGSLSADMYNLTRANDILRRYDLYMDMPSRAKRAKERQGRSLVKNSEVPATPMADEA